MCAVLTVMWFIQKWFNTKVYRMKYFVHEIFAIYCNFCIIIIMLVHLVGWWCSYWCGQYHCWSYHCWKDLWICWVRFKECWEVHVCCLSLSLSLPPPFLPPSLPPSLLTDQRPTHCRSWYSTCIRLCTENVTSTLLLTGCFVSLHSCWSRTHSSPIWPGTYSHE